VPSFIRRPLAHPSQVLVFSFIGLILAGAALLWLPQAASGQRLSLVDALFTATSAVCVTGLVVVRTGADLSPFGQVVVLVLIQLGGLGITVFSTLILLLLGRPITFRAGRLLAESHQRLPGAHWGRLFLAVFIWTAVLEAAGAALFLVRFAGQMPLGQAAWWAVFSSVSAFCNAGFGLSEQSFVPYAGDWLVNLTLMGLIVSGGLGFLVLDELWGRLARRDRKPLSLHTRLVLWFSGLLILVGAGAIFVLEWPGALGEAPWGQRVLVSLFQSVTARTAGFNTIDLGLLSNASLLILVSLMFIGASPGSCGGGIKTTTFALFFAVIKARLREEARPHLFSRSLSAESLSRSVTLLLMSGGVVIIFTMLVAMATPQPGCRDCLVEVFFEVVSAFGTVGLSLGITPDLTAPAKGLITILMLLGRLGPLTLAGFLMGRSKPERFFFAEEPVMIG